MMQNGLWLSHTAGWPSQLSQTPMVSPLPTVVPGVPTTRTPPYYWRPYYRVHSMYHPVPDTGGRTTVVTQSTTPVPDTGGRTTVHGYSKYHPVPDTGGRTTVVTQSTTPVPDTGGRTTVFTQSTTPSLIPAAVLPWLLKVPPRP